MEIKDVLDKYVEIDKRFLEESIRNPSRTEWITMRVPVHVKEFYRKLPPALKKAVREAFMNMVVDIFTQYANDNIPEIPSNANVVVNVQTPPIIVNTIHNNNNVDVHVDLGEAVSLLRDIKQLIYNWHRSGLIPRAAYGNAYGKLKQLEKLLVKRN